MKEKRLSYKGENITVSYALNRCIHSAVCVRNLPDVFEPPRKPWIIPDNDSADRVADVVMRCPTGALHFTRNDGGAEEPTPEENNVLVRPNGPYFLRGDLHIATPDGEETMRDVRMALCRCGASKNKPFCDNSHLTIGFRDNGLREATKIEELPSDPVQLTITPTTNGSLKIEGPVRVFAANGDVVFQGSKTFLCRCGHSSNKPFCDGTHKRISFSDQNPTEV